ncbi:18368_t:CDS:2 [Dentiscutata erythropus]|uniref:18368_t:CDS:1 n=1 Tax=Dentiscutata erythropus TaxID=1348616 RepID=A0A9N9HR03_9GLOM|nr:18368_t:CDS:2 [Dentiscutata erythropus]
MPCYADTIVKVKIVRQTAKEEDNLLVVWAVGSYPVEREDNDLEMVLFVPIDSSKRDPETQAIFERNSFFSVGGKILPGYYEGNKRPKELPKEFNSKDAVFCVMISDYISGQEYNFPVKVVFLFLNPRFAHLRNTVHPQESLVFIVGDVVQDNVSDNSLKKENSQKKRKGKEVVCGSLCSALRS